MDKPKALNPIEAHETIHGLLNARGSISYTSHVRDRMRQRHFTMDDVHRVLLYGTVSSDAQWNEAFQNWTYTITGTDYDNDPLAIVIALEPLLSRITVITGHDV